MTHSSLLISALAHIGLLILAAVGLPALHDAPDPLEVPIPVTVTMVSERTEAKGPLPPLEPSPPDTAPDPPEPEPAVAETPPAETPPAEPVVAEPPPVETPPAEPVPQEEPVQVAALAPEPPKPEPLPEPEPASAVAPLPPSPPEPEKAPPASDPKPPPLPQRPPQQQVRAKPAPKPPEPQPAPEPPPLPQAAPEDPPDELKALREAALPNDLDTLRSAVSDETPPAHEEAEEPVFTVSEKHRLFRQLSRCWQTIPGLAPSERHIVVLQVALGSDQRVTSIKAVDGKGSRSYRAAQERAERALRHPFCEQLDVPPDKMGLWKSLTLRFDPHRMQ